MKYRKILFVLSCLFILGFMAYVPAYLISKVIGMDFNLENKYLYIIAFVSFIVGIAIIDKFAKYLDALPKKKEGEYIRIWGNDDHLNKYLDVFGILTRSFPEGYYFTKDEVKQFKSIYDNCIYEVKDNYFNSKETSVKFTKAIRKDDQCWLIAILQYFCDNKLGHYNSEIGNLPLFEYSGIYEEHIEGFEEPSKYSKYTLTDIGIVANKVLLASTVFINQNDEEHENDSWKIEKAKKAIDNGWELFY